jgi:hypothetical protein
MRDETFAPQYATAHIDHQIHLLRDFLQTLSSPTTPQNALISPSALHTLSRIKADVVETIRKVVGVVSTYAGGALPEAARRRVKDLVLALPERWAMANPAGGEEGDREEGPTIVAAKAATGRVLSLAVEGLDMLSGCAGIFGESLERAEMCVPCSDPALPLFVLVLMSTLFLSSHVVQVGRAPPDSRSPTGGGPSTPRPGELSPAAAHLGRSSRGKGGRAAGSLCDASANRVRRVALVNDNDDDDRHDRLGRLDADARE